jgi:hypothetical protein
VPRKCITERRTSPLDDALELEDEMKNGYSKNYKDKEKLFGFYMWLRHASLKSNVKNIEALKLCRKQINAELQRLIK